MSEHTTSDPLFPMQRTPVHFLVIEGWKPSGEVDLVFKCEAGPGERCRLRPADDREEWTYADPDLVDSGKCWAHEWIQATGLYDGAIATFSGEYGRVPVTIAYAEGVEISPIPPEPTVLPTTHAILNQPGAIHMCDLDDMQNLERDHTAIQYDGTNMAEVLDFLRRYDMPFWKDASTFGTDSGYHGGGEDPIEVGDWLEAHPPVGVYRKPLPLEDADEPSALASFARWVVSHDDPDELGSARRAVVSLNSIIEHARVALATTEGA